MYPSEYIPKHPLELCSKKLTSEYITNPNERTQMLVISRRNDETLKIFIPPSSEVQVIEIQAVECTSNKVRLGFTADDQIKIYRSELLRHFVPELLTRTVTNPIDLDNVLSTIPSKPKNENKNP
jgi:carbon storage regulator CsrA